MADDFKALAAYAQEHGWASGSSDIDSIRKQAALLGWLEIPPRKGDAAVSVLRPVGTDAAHPRSLSATYGLGQQPLHTDGAHLPDPPELIVLISQRPNATPTRLWLDNTHGRQGDIPWDALKHGMFLVHNGPDSFYAPVRSGRRYQYDPGCMTPCDARAREVQRYFTDHLTKAETYDWSDAAQVLVVDNHHVLQLVRP
jgi:hypothetical protein